MINTKDCKVIAKGTRIDTLIYRFMVNLALSLRSLLLKKS
jgi:hypothetical protein